MKHEQSDHTGSDHLTCRDTTHLVCGSRDEPLTPAQQARLQAHLAHCDYCRVASRQFGQLFEQLDQLFARDAGPA